MKDKMRIFLALLALIFATVWLVSCSSDEDGEGAPVREEKDYGTATVYAPGDDVQIITTGQPETEKFKADLDKMLNKGGSSSNFGSLYSQNKKREILIGIENSDGTRPIIDVAKRHLQRLEQNSIFDSRYVIYADSGQIAIVFDDNLYTNLRPISYILDVLAEKYLLDKGYMALPSGVIATGTIDLIEEQEELDIALVAERWAGLEKILGQETADAFRVLYSMYDDKLIGWAANLYDPGVGGFYTCRTGRNGDEFGPDIECTMQIINFISRSGMVDDLGTAPAEFLPEKMQQQLIYFAKSLQDENGYFYHPQWGQAFTDGQLSRRGRDLGWATQLLSALGSKPTYNTPNGHKGDGITADEYWDSLIENGAALGPRPYSALDTPDEEDIISGSLTGRLGNSSAVAVSKIIATAEENPEDAVVNTSTAYLQNHVNFINYLLTKVGPGVDANPYSMGNTLNATTGQIDTASKNLGAYSYTAGDEQSSTDSALAVAQFKVNTDSDPTNNITLAQIYELLDGKTLSEMTIYILNEKINPEIGLWGKTSESNPTGTEFLFTNGFFKIIPLYNNLKIAYPAEHVEKAAGALMAGLLGDQSSVGNICEVFNVWSAIDSLKSNVKYLDDSIKVTDDSGKTVRLEDKVKADIDRIVRENSSAAILNTYEKISGYKKEDGGFDHVVKRTGSGYATQQGHNTGYAINGQSNIDATCIGSTGLLRGIYTVFGIKSYEEVPLYTESDWMRMLEIFINLQPVIKYTTERNVDIEDVQTFDEDYSDAITINTNSNFTAYNTWSVVKKDNNNMLFINKDGKDTSGKTFNGGVSTYLKVTEKEPNAEYMICEFDIILENIKGMDTQITLRHGSFTTKGDSPFLLTLPKGKYNEKYHVIFTYKVTQKDENGVPVAFETLYQINDSMAIRITDLAAAATNIKSGKTPLPLIKDVKSVAIGFNNSFLGDIYLDNMSLMLVGELPEYVNVPADLEAPEEPEKEIGFDFAYSEALKVTTNDAFIDKNRWTVVETDGNKELYIQKYGTDTTANAYGGVTLTLSPTEKQAGAKYMVLEFDSRFENLKGNETQIIIQHSKKTGKLNSPILVNLPKGTADRTMHVVLIYEVTASDSEGKASAFKATYIVNGEVLNEITATQSSGQNILSGKTPLPTIDSIESVAIGLNNKFLGDVYFDNMSLKLLAELPEGIIPGGDTPEVDFEAAEKVISFDNDYSESLSISTLDEYKETNTWTVIDVDGNKKLFIDKNGRDGSGVTFNGGVTLTISPTVKQVGARYMVFEIDGRLENVNGFDTQIIIQQEKYKGKINSPILFGFVKGRYNEDLHMTVIYEILETDSAGKPITLKATQIINGEIISQTTEIHEQGKNIISGKTPLPAVSDVASIALSFNNNFKGDVYLDNISLQLLRELPEDIFHEHVYVEGKCECGAEDPSYVPPHEHVYVEGKCECGEEDPSYVPPHEHVYVEGKCECGAEDPSYVPPHEHVYVEGKCECGATKSANIPNLDNGGWSKP